MKCSECGTENEEGARFCAECGSTLAEADETLVIGAEPRGGKEASLVLSTGESFDLKEGDNVVGRKDEGVAVDIDLGPFDKDKYTSRKHCIISLEGGKLFVTDLSSNGTFLQDKRLDKNAKTAAPAGSKIKFVKIEGKLQA
jgi:hypothetical protein